MKNKNNFYLGPIETVEAVPTDKVVEVTAGLLFKLSNGTEVVIREPQSAEQQKRFWADVFMIAEQRMLQSMRK